MGHDGRFIADRAQLDPTPDDVIEAYDTDDDLLWRRDILEIYTGYFGIVDTDGDNIPDAARDGIAVYPPLKHSPEVHYYKKRHVDGAFSINKIQMEMVRESSEDYLYLPADAQLKGEADCDPTVMDQFDSVAASMALSHRPYSMAFPSTRDEASNAAEFPGPNTLSSFYIEGIPFTPPNNNHDTVKVALLAMSVQGEAGQTYPVDFTLRLEEVSGNDTTVLESDSKDDVEVPGVGDGGARLVPRWGIPQQSYQARAIMSDEDVNVLNQHATVVILSINYSDHTQPTQDTSADVDVADDHPLPWLLELEIQGDTVVALPYVWTEASDRP
jgi:hypothetical protein